MNQLNDKFLNYIFYDENINDFSQFVKLYETYIDLLKKNQKYENLIETTIKSINNIQTIYDESEEIYKNLNNQATIYQDIYDFFSEKYKEFIINGLDLDFKRYIINLYLFYILTIDYFNYKYEINIISLYIFKILINDYKSTTTQ